MKKSLTTITIIFTLLLPVKTFAATQFDRNLLFSSNSAHIVTFDKKIIRYKFENDKTFKGEILSNINNSRQELLIKPVKDLDNKLTVWTSAGIYNFDIQFDKNEEDLKLDVPPALSQNPCGVEDFELDNPPKHENSQPKQINLRE